MGWLSKLIRRDECYDDTLAAIKKAVQCVEEKDEKSFYFIYPDTLENEKRFEEYREALKKVAKETDRELMQIAIPSSQDVFTLLEPVVNLLDVESVENLHLPIAFSYDPEIEDDKLFYAYGVWEVRK